MSGIVHTSKAAHTVSFDDFNGTNSLWSHPFLALCRSLLNSEQLIQVLRQHPALEALKLCSCPRVTDEALQSLPGNSLEQLTLVCCDGITGKPLSQLKKLETLQISSCNAVTEEAIQVR